MNVTDLSPREALEFRYSETFPDPFSIIVEKDYSCMIPRAMLFYMQADKFEHDFIVGDNTLDKEASKALVPAYATIEFMLNIHDNGFPFKLNNTDNAKEIYEVLSLHIKACLLHNEDPFRGEPVDLRTLQKMDQFLADMFPNFKYSINKETFDENDARDRFNKAVGTISKKKLEQPINPDHVAIINAEIGEQQWTKTVDDGLGDGLGDFNFGGEDWV